MKTVVVSGIAGFVGFSVAKRLLHDGWRVVGFDNFNSYYDVALKRARVAELTAMGGNLRLEELDLVDGEGVKALLLAEKPEVVVHLAAQASVRYGLVNQVAYLNSNLIGHFNMLAAAKALTDAGSPLQHFLYASSSSVYGNQDKTPFSEDDDVSKPVSLYAATKRADEMITHAWAHQFGLPCTGMRFFTVYGPWGRPDMTPVLFAKAILDGKPIPLFNAGDLWRDFTYVDDIVEAMVRLMDVPPAAAPTPHRIFNLGNQSPVRMSDFVAAMGRVLGKEPIVDVREWPPTEVYQTFADTTKLQEAVGWRPSTALEDGLRHFAEWYVGWHGKIAM